MSEMEKNTGEESGQARMGMDAIGEALSRLYPGQEGTYYGAMIPASLGGKDPLDGVEVWESRSKMPHWHYVRIWPGMCFPRETASLPAIT